MKRLPEKNLSDLHPINDRSKLVPLTEQQEESLFYQLLNVGTNAGFFPSLGVQIEFSDLVQLIELMEQRLTWQPVLQPWVMRLPLMQQTVLLTAVRGPDNIEKYSAAKNVLRWLRRCVLLSAMDRQALRNPYVTNGGSFTGPSLKLAEDALIDASDDELNASRRWGPKMDEVVAGYIQQLDATPLHFHMHLMHAAQVLGYKHPDAEIAYWWRTSVYERFVHHQHLWPESREEMDKRLGDKREDWVARNDPATLR